MYRVLKLNESAELKENTEEHDLSRDLYGDEADKRANEDQRALEKYLQLAREIKDGKNDTISLDSAKKLLKNAYIKAKSYYSFEPEEIDKRIAKDIPDLFEGLKEGEHLKANRNFIEELIKAGALDDYDELKNDEKAFNDAVDYWVEHYFDDYSDTEIDQAKEDGIAYDVARDLGIEPGSEEENQLNGLYEAEEPEDEETAEDIEQQNEIEDNAEETVDSEDDQDENPIEEESDLDKELDEIRNILVDLDDIRLYKIVGDDDEFYILGKVSDSSNDVEMLVDTQPADVYDNPEESGNKIIPQEQIEAKFQFVTLPKKIDMIKDMYPKYGKELNPRHEELISYLTNLLIEQNPEAAEELNNEEDIEINEPENNLPDETPEELDEPIINNKEDEEDYE